MPLRLEFVGDTVESLRRFDPDSQRSIESVDQFLLVPVRDFALTAAAPPPGAAGLHHRLPRAGRGRRGRARRRAGAGGTGVCPRAGDRSRSGPEARTRRRCCLPRRSSFDGPTWRRCFARGNGTAGAERRRAARSTRLQVAYQPPQEFKGRIPDWVADVRQALARADTVLFVAGSRGRAERTVELLRDYDVRASWAGHGSDQPAGAVTRGRRPALPRLPAARRRADGLRRGRRLRGRAPARTAAARASDRRPPRFSPTSAT